MFRFIYLFIFLLTIKAKNKTKDSKNGKPILMAKHSEGSFNKFQNPG